MATKLGDWLKMATKEERAELARRAGTSVGYLRLLGYGVRENPKVRLALAICDAMHVMWDGGRGRMPKLSIRDLAAVPEKGGK